MRAPRGSEGFTLFELILALALLGISLLVLLEQSAENTRGDVDRAARLVAHRTLRNEVERLRASDPMAGTFPVTFHTDRAGNVIAAAATGSHEVTVGRRVVCLGGALDRDNATSPPVAYGCGLGSAPMAEFTVRVVFPSRYTEGATATVEQVVTLWLGDRHGGAWSPASG